MGTEATKEQLNIIRKLGYDTENNHYSMKMYSDIIGNLPVEKDKLEQLKEHGYDISFGATLFEFNMAKQELSKKGISIK
jgi:hypothetical protein